ncbi:Putative RxLR effector [Phytophthora palmivora]|uniref:RxLR effector protein n=1 Tax=Phytophthora palmivora TaxID=4796 RepID=A0A2P4XEI7_9STRA|nr:Putative RxLR effector [Phytophthora palmivora]
MRFYDIVLLTATAVLTLTDATSISEQINTAPFGISDGNTASTARFLRKREAVEEERGGFKDIVEKVMRKTNKLAQYNKWIFGKKTPEWVAKHHPKFAKGYERSWEN